MAVSTGMSSIQSTYRYKIGGLTDTLFSSVGSLIKENEVAFNALKNSRTRTIFGVKALETTEPDIGLRQKKQGELRLEGLDPLIKRLKEVYMKDGKDKAKSIANSMMQISRELQASVDTYIKGRNAITDGNDYSADDAAFFAKAEATMTTLETMKSRVKTYLLQSKVVFSTQLNWVKKYNSTTRDMITAFSGGASAMAAAPSGDGAAAPEGVDILV